jgi:putative ABC transport system permease protein
MALLLLVRTFYESALQALQQLLANKLRSFLSLLGITIGIWCIIAVFSAIDSLEDNIRGSFQKLGDDVVYINKQPWGEDPEMSFWKYSRRPNPSYDDFLEVEKRLKDRSLTAYNLFMGFGTLQHGTLSAANVFMVAATYDYGALFALSFDKGRYFSRSEHSSGADHVLLGYDVAATLFRPGENPIGQKIKLNGRYMQVIGVIEKAGNDLINPFKFDNACVISYASARKFANVRAGSMGSWIAVKAPKGGSIEKLKDDVTMAMRGARKLSPVEDDNFSLNTLSIISNAFDVFFGGMKLVGFIIGIFSIIVGVFSVANIMFVSVRERTGIIGIKKALGAKSAFILTEFLVESIVLCSVGGLVGILLVWLSAFAATSIFDFPVYLSVENILLGLGISIATGIVAGLTPAIQAARMDPVEAIRQSK